MVVCHLGHGSKPNFTVAEVTHFSSSFQCVLFKATVCECVTFLWFSPAAVAVCGCMNNSGTMSEAAVQTVGGEIADEACSLLPTEIFYYSY